MGKPRPGPGSDSPKVTRRAAYRRQIRFGHFRNLTGSRASSAPKGISRTHSPWGVESKKTPRCADRSSGLCPSRGRGCGTHSRRTLHGSGGGTPAGPGASRRGPLAGTCCSPGLTRSPAATHEPAGRLHPEPVPAGRLAGCHTAGPLSARYAPSRARPARVRHYAIPRPRTQPHPAGGSDWLSAPPAWGLRAFHWPE